MFEETNRVYGCRRLRKALADRGIDLSEWKVRRIMRENGMYPLTLVKYKPGKKEKPDGRYFDNFVNFGVRAEAARSFSRGVTDF